MISVLSLLNKTPFSELYAGLSVSTSKEVKLEHILKALFSIFATDFGINIAVKPDFSKASSPIFVTLTAQKK